MLKKLLKYDLTSTFKLVWPFYLLVALLSAAGFVCGLIAFQTAGESDDLLPTLFVVLCTIFYGLTSLAVSVGSAVLAYIPYFHFYRHLFTDEGYLTFTLPISMSDHLLSKTITAYVTTLIGALIGGGCSMLISSTSFMAGDIADISIFMPLFGEVFEEFGLFGTVSSLVGLLLMMLTASFASVTMTLLSITLGGIVFKKHKILGSIGCYLGVSGAFSAIATVFLFLIFILTGIVGVSTESVAGAVSLFIYSLAIGFGILGVVCYVITLHLFNKKLNLQ